MSTVKNHLVSGGRNCPCCRRYGPQENDRLAKANKFGLEKALEKMARKRRTDEDEKAIQISLRKQVFGENYT